MEENIGLTLVRHGRSRADDEGVHEGRYDSPLTDTGRAQAEKRGQYLLAQGTKYQLIIASPLKRTQETAVILAKHLNVPVITDNEWIELDNGPLAGLSFKEAEIHYPEPAFRNPYEKMPGNGESAWELYSRAEAAVGQIIQRGSGEYIVVAHGGILNAALRSIVGSVPYGNGQGIGFKFNDLGCMKLRYYPGKNWWMMEEFLKSQD
jgi:2,3-bisphosphoglycerate-dependent phosphoglycerate mutase